MSMAAVARDIAGRLHHRGCLISPEYQGLAADLKEIAITDLARLRDATQQRHRELVASYGFEPVVADKPFAFSGGVAFIPVHGILLNKLSWGSSYATGYNYIRDLYQAAVADRDVRAIVYDVNSPGGGAAGCGECAAELYTRQKPSLAVVDARAYSAAFWLSSAADKIAVTPSGGVGSIGVVAMHVDFSGMLEADGIKITFIHAGAEKVDGNPFEALSDRARATIQRDVDHHYGLFVGAVARHRDLSEEAVRATEARTYLPDEAKSLGLVDSVASPAAALRQFLEGGTIMPSDNNQTADVRTLVAQALAEDRARQAAIRTSSEAAGKPRLADHLALNTNMSVDEARAILAAAAKEPEPANPNGFAAAMDRDRHPNVGADTPGDARGGNGAGGDDTPTHRANSILKNFGRVTGTKIKTIEHEAAA